MTAREMWVVLDKARKLRPLQKSYWKHRRQKAQAPKWLYPACRGLEHDIDRALWNLYESDRSEPMFGQCLLVLQMREAQKAFYGGNVQPRDVALRRSMAAESAVDAMLPLIPGYFDDAPSLFDSGPLDEEAVA